MKNSNRFKQLEERIDFLRNNLLPQSKINGDYSDLEQDLTRSFVLLVHAEIENYLEDRVEEKVNTSFNSWKTNRKRSNVIASINAFCNHDLDTGGKHTKSNKQNIEYRLNLNIQKYKSIIYTNHGIKRDNIIDLLLPLGIEINDIDDTWLSIMDNFGSNRGLIAHKKHTIQLMIDPKTVLNDVYLNILPELKQIDLKLIKVT
ncbi:HEPN domain-containing protein [Sphingobacterium kitahiroshimense]|uniref:HEPN domain-containing protein n=1 Tax=Sphingobacterium kitahiroshimense TaxID=470446 RepID=UPI00320B973F